MEFFFAIKYLIVTGYIKKIEITPLKFCNIRFYCGNKAFVMAFVTVLKCKLIVVRGNIYFWFSFYTDNSYQARQPILYWQRVIGTCQHPLIGEVSWVDSRSSHHSLWLPLSVMVYCSYIAYVSLVM